MSQAVVRRCDFRITEKRKYTVCNQDVPGNVPTVFSAGDESAYAVDLCDKHKLHLQEVLAPFIEIADTEYVQVGPAVVKALRATDGSKFTSSEAREWLRNQGYPVANSGMIKQDLLDLYLEARK